MQLFFVLVYYFLMAFWLKVQFFDAVDQLLIKKLELEFGNAFSVEKLFFIGVAFWHRKINFIDLISLSYKFIISIWLNHPQISVILTDILLEKTKIKQKKYLLSNTLKLLQKE